MPSSVAAGATSEPAPSENPEPNAYEADHMRAFGAKASWRSSNAMPPATPGCSASYNPSTRFRCTTRPVISTADPATNIASWAATTLREIIHARSEARAAAELRPLPQNAASTSTAMTAAPTSWNLPRLTQPRRYREGGHEVSRDRDNADQRESRRLVTTNVPGAHRCDPREHETR